MPAVPEFTITCWPRLSRSAWSAVTQADPLASTTTSSPSKWSDSASTNTYGLIGVSRRRYSGRTTGYLVHRAVHQANHAAFDGSSGSLLASSRIVATHQPTSA